MTERRPRVRAANEVRPADLVLSLCHEVANILAGTRLALHLVAKGLVEGDFSESAARIEAETTRAGAYLGQIRPLLEEGPSPRPRIGASEVLSVLERSLGRAAGGPPQLSIRLPRSVPDVRVDPDALHHVLVALVLSAADVTSQRNRVRVSAHRSGARVVFQIEDDGGVLEAGPAPGQVPRRGRPLVLAAATVIVRRQGGRMSALPRPAKRGTCIRIELPAAGAIASRTGQPRARRAPRGFARSGSVR